LEVKNVIPTRRREILVIAFDLANVLVQVDHFIFCRQLAQVAGTTPAAVYEAVFASSLEPGYDTGRMSTEEFFQAVCAQWQVSLSLAQFASWWNSIFAPMPGMEAVVEHLAAAYPLHLLSNTNSLHFQYIRENYPLLAPFRSFVLSYEVGSRKPEAAIYQALIRRAERAPEEILFVDDKPEFVAAAQAQGLQAWQFTDRDRLIRQLQDEGLW